jgi:hypothetical protein
MLYRGTNPGYVGSNPAPTIVVHQNDVVEMHLVNPTGNLFAHNIDFHAATGAMGGGSISMVSPGEEVIPIPISFCLNPLNLAFSRWRSDSM